MPKKQSQQPSTSTTSSATSPPPPAATKNFSVGIVGGGLVGSLAAVYAAQKGWDVHVYELRKGWFYDTIYIEWMIRLYIIYTNKITINPQTPAKKTLHEVVPLI